MSVCQVRRKVLRRFYEPLLLLDALGQVRGSPIKQILPPETEDLHEAKQRRTFANAIAYISAYQIGSDHVTAVALENTADGIVIWLAANGGIESKVMSFLQTLCSEIELTVSTMTAQTMEYEEHIKPFINKVLTFGAPRNLHYYQKIRSVGLQPCFGVLEELALHIQPKSSLLGANVGVEMYKAFASCNSLFNLKELFFFESSPTDATLDSAAFICHTLRTEGTLKILQDLAQANPDLGHEFCTLYRLLCKLGKHITWTRRLLDASFACSSDIRRGLRTVAVASPEPQPFPLASWEATVKSTIGRMYSDKNAQNEFRERLKALNEADQLPRAIESNRNIKTKVHAELLLINHFDLNQCTFLDPEDRYIACSKPSCYLCYAYIAAHPGRYVVSASHQKLYLHWRIPDTPEGLGDYNERIEFQERIVLDLIKKVRLDLQAEVKSDAARCSVFPDSSAGTSTDRAQPILSWLGGLLSSRASQASVALEAQSATDFVLGGLSFRREITRTEKHSYEYNDASSSSDDSDGGVKLNLVSS